LTQELDRLVEAYLDDIWERGPVAGTDAGIHDYDDRLPSFAPDALQEGYEKDKDWLAKFEALDPSELDQDAWLDRLVAMAQLRRSIGDYEEFRPAFRNPGVYVNVVSQAVFSLIERDHAPFDERMRCVLSRLRGVPTMLDQACSNLSEETPAVFADSALQHLTGAVRFLESTVPELAGDIPEMEDELLAANRDALAALERFGTVVARLAEEGGADFAVGKRYYDFLLQKHHLLPLDSEAVLEMGRVAIDEIKDELKKVGEEIDPTLSWPEIVEELKRDHPPTEGVLEMYQDEVTGSRQFIEERDLVTIPDEEGFWVEWVPPFMWATLPFHASYPPRPFEEDDRGFWRITPPDPAASPEEQEQKLQGHNRWNARALAMHEGYPGHHMHFCLIKRLPSKIRRQFMDPFLVEGWALYTEELMWEQGFFDDLRGRLIQLVNALWRAVRVVAGVSMHTRGMTVDEAAEMLVEISRLGPTNARIEAQRFTYTPTYTISYHTGKALVSHLRADYESRLGDGFDLKSFHDELLSYGAVSPAVIQDLMKSGGDATQTS